MSLSFRICKAWDYDSIRQSSPGLHRRWTLKLCSCNFIFFSSVYLPLLLLLRIFRYWELDAMYIKQSKLLHGTSNYLNVNNTYLTLVLTQFHMYATTGISDTTGSIPIKRFTKIISNRKSFAYLYNHITYHLRNASVCIRQIKCIKCL